MLESHMFVQFYLLTLLVLKFDVFFYALTHQQRVIDVNFTIFDQKAVLNTRRVTRQVKDSWKINQQNLFTK